MESCSTALPIESDRRPRPLNHGTTQRNQQRFDSTPLDSAINRMDQDGFEGFLLAAIHLIMIADVGISASMKGSERSILIRPSA